MIDQQDAEQIIKAIRDYDTKKHAKDIKTKQDNRLRNTKLLLENYNYFKAHADKSIYSSEQLESVNDIGELDDYKPHMLIESIKRSSYKTYLMLAHIDKMLKIYEIYTNMEGEKQQRAFRVMKKFYLDKLKMADILVEESIAERTFNRDIAESVHCLSGFLFGFDSINEMAE